MSMNERLRAAIDASGMKVSEFAETTGIPYRTLQQYLAGDRQPGADGLAKICAHSSVDVNWLLTGSGSMYRGMSAAAEVADDLTEHERKVLALYRALAEVDQREIQAVAEEKKRLRDVESQLEEVRAELALLKKRA